LFRHLARHFGEDDGVVGAGNSQLMHAYASLIRKDPALRDLARLHGHPDPFLWNDQARAGGTKFASLIMHIAGQQISEVVALLMFDRIRAAIGRLPDPRGIIALGRQGLIDCGASRAKAAYMTGLAEMQLSGEIDVEHLDRLTDAEALAALTSLRGIGRWSADLFLIFQLHRVDILPAGDLGIRRAVRRAWSEAEVPTIKQVDERGAAWAPWRTYAAALLWESVRPRQSETVSSST